MKMKKVLAICFALVMVFSLSTSAFAAPGAFEKSPSGNPAPVIVNVKIDGNNTWNCGDKIVVTAHADRGELDAATRETIEYAYDDIVMSDYLTELNADLAKVAADKKIDGKKLAVSDLFDVSVVGCADNDHVSYEITLEAETLDKFIGLLHMYEKGKWELVSNAQVIEGGKQLKFTVNSLSPFAIVVEGAGKTPQTGDSSNIYIYVIILAVSALALIAVLVIKKKTQK